MDEENPMEIERAKAIANVGQTIINSATLEVRAINAMRIAGGSPKKSEFFGTVEWKAERPALEFPQSLQRKRRRPKARRCATRRARRTASATYGPRRVRAQSATRRGER